MTGRAMRKVHLCFGGPTLKIMVRGKLMYFEEVPYCGVMPTTKDGDGRKLGPNDPFWKAVDAWVQGGKRIENGLCVT